MYCSAGGRKQEEIDASEVPLFELFCLVAVSLLSFLFPLFLLLFFSYEIAADAALKEEHVIDGRTIDVKRAVPRDRAPQPRLVRVIWVGSYTGKVGDWGCKCNLNMFLFLARVGGANCPPLPGITCVPFCLATAASKICFSLPCPAVPVLPVV